MKFAMNVQAPFGYYANSFLNYSRTKIQKTKKFMAEEIYFNLKNFRRNGRSPWKLNSNHFPPKSSL